MCAKNLRIRKCKKKLLSKTHFLPRNKVRRALFLLLIFCFVFQFSWFRGNAIRASETQCATESEQEQTQWIILSDNFHRFCLWYENRFSQLKKIEHTVYVCCHRLFIYLNVIWELTVGCVYIPNASLCVQSLLVSSPMTCSSCIFRRQNIVQKNKLNWCVSPVGLQIKWFRLSISSVHSFY